MVYVARDVAGSCYWGCVTIRVVRDVAGSFYWGCVTIRVVRDVTVRVACNVTPFAGRDVTVLVA